MAVSVPVAVCSCHSSSHLTTTYPRSQYVSLEASTTLIVTSCLCAAWSLRIAARTSSRVSPKAAMLTVTTRLSYSMSDSDTSCAPSPACRSVDETLASGAESQPATPPESQSTLRPEDASAA